MRAEAGRAAGRNDIGSVRAAAAAGGRIRHTAGGCPGPFLAAWRHRERIRSLSGGRANARGRGGAYARHFPAPWHEA